LLGYEGPTATQNTKKNEKAPTLTSRKGREADSLIQKSTSVALKSMRNEGVAQASFQ